MDLTIFELNSNNTALFHCHRVRNPSILQFIPREEQSQTISEKVELRHRGSFLEPGKRQSSLIIHGRVDIDNILVMLLDEHLHESLSSHHERLDPLWSFFFKPCFYTG